jgi:hypothetical protein
MCRYDSTIRATSWTQNRHKTAGFVPPLERTLKSFSRLPRERESSHQALGKPPSIQQMDVVNLLFDSDSPTGRRPGPDWPHWNNTNPPFYDPYNDHYVVGYLDNRIRSQWIAVFTLLLIWTLLLLAKYAVHAVAYQSGRRGHILLPTNDPGVVRAGAMDESAGRYGAVAPASDDDAIIKAAGWVSVFPACKASFWFACKEGKKYKAHQILIAGSSHQQSHENCSRWLDYAVTGHHCDSLGFIRFFLRLCPFVVDLLWLDPGMGYCRTGSIGQPYRSHCGWVAFIPIDRCHCWSGVPRVCL